MLCPIKNGVSHTFDTDGPVIKWIVCSVSRSVLLVRELECVGQHSPGCAVPFLVGKALGPVLCSPVCCRIFKILGNISD